MTIEQACPYCGQFIAIEAAEGTPEEECEELAKGRRACPAAERERDIKDALCKLEQCCGDASTDRGFAAPLNSEIMHIFRRMVEWAVDMAFQEAQVKCLSGDTVTITSKAKGVKIKRKGQIQVQL